MAPPEDDCLKKLPEKDETWDRCIRRSSLGIGIGGLLGGVSSLFIGTGGVAFSIGLCVTWAIKHCRALFREEEEKRRQALEELCKEEPPKKPEEECFIQEAIIGKKEDECILEKPCTPTFNFPPVLPIPDKPFGRVCCETQDVQIEKTAEDDCKCTLKEVESEMKIQCICPLPESEEYKSTDQCIDKKKLPEFAIECMDKEPETCDTPSPYVPPIEDKCTCLDAPPPIPEPKQCTCPPPPPIKEPECICTKIKPECPPPEPECTCSKPEPQCTCPFT